MDKPITMPVKTWLIRGIAVRRNMQESLIETIVNHQFESALSALVTENSLEFSGFGRFLFNRPKAIKKLEKFRSQLRVFDRIINDPSTTERRRMNMELKKEVTIKNFNYLNAKLNEHSTDLRGVEESPFPSEGVEGVDSEGGGDEDVDL